MPPRINLPPITRALLLLVLALSALNASIRLSKWRASLADAPASHVATTPSNYFSAPEWAVPFLVLVPIYIIHQPWVFLTAALVENNIVSLAISLSVLWFGGRYLERAWGSKEFGKFVLFVTMIPNFGAFLVYGIWHAAVGKPQFPTPIQGLIALEAGFLVALKQLVPEHTVALFKATLRVRIKHFPALFTLANIISGPLLGTDTALWLSLFGFLTGWIYLRFFRITEITTASATGGEGSTMKGDASDTFAFVAFWPDIMQPYLAPVCDGIYDTLVAVKVCTPFSEEAIEAGNEGAASRSEGLPSIMDGRGGSGRRAEAERRRALALKALDQRLNSAAANRTAGAPVALSAAPMTPAEAPEAAVGAPMEIEEPVKEVQA
ncbi:hypothetical protein LTR78_005075 [Recurvomyces mirabilis]|uniref:DUF1751-domain-containing protein n=1 Tax=Recurvomyces mirabilis TaxID=574656 RepID=A0AAE0WNN8_9PEZI|nr:hypothetical protein LTR78_005075 [Recurvomyces mirabilis]KAK5158308.1 hypothetical protein LTS14_003326 [Recurvomyces mirabilis]